jgi:regulator of CtrA degradation
MVASGEARIMSDKSVDELRPVLFGEKLASSQNFSQLFRDGMKLVEETAAYLDGPGRQESKLLDRSAALGYATESMRLTTRLMQLASWLLLHRAVNEGEMSLAQANKERMKVKLAPDERPEDTGMVLPERLLSLVARSKKLQDEVRRLDTTIHAPMPEARGGGNPLEHQMGILRAAFERSAK